MRRNVVRVHKANISSDVMITPEVCPISLRRIFISLGRENTFASDGIKPAAQPTNARKQIDESEPAVFFRSQRATFMFGKRQALYSLDFGCSWFAFAALVTIRGAY